LEKNLITSWNRCSVDILALNHQQRTINWSCSFQQWYSRLPGYIWLHIPLTLYIDQCFSKWAESPPWGRFWWARGRKKWREC